MGRAPKDRGDPSMQMNNSIESQCAQENSSAPNEKDINGVQWKGYSRVFMNYSTPSSL